MKLTKEEVKMLLDWDMFLSRPFGYRRSSSIFEWEDETSFVGSTLGGSYRAANIQGDRVIERLCEDWLLMQEILEDLVPDSKIEEIKERAKKALEEK